MRPICMLTIVSSKIQPFEEAVSDAYQGILPKGRYPLVLLRLEVSPDQVDVNVHPAKTEVRFQQVLDVGRSITQGLRDAMQEHGIRREVSTQNKPTPLPRTLGENLPLFGNPSSEGLQRPQAVPPIVREPRLTPLPPLPTPVSKINPSQDTRLDNVRVDNTSVIPPQDISAVAEVQVDNRTFPPSIYSWSIEDTTEHPSESFNVPVHSPMDAFGFSWPEFDESDDAVVSLGDLLPVPRFSDLLIIGQLKRTYILCEGEGELVIIDQHAAHERITLDAIQRRRMDFIGGFQHCWHQFN